MSTTTFNEGSFDAVLREGFKKLPIDETSPGLKADILKRIRENDLIIRKRNFFMNILFRASQGVFALSLVMMAAFLPSLIETSGTHAVQEAAMIRTSADDRVVSSTNVSQKVYYSTKPNYAYVNYVSYP
jgi:hypothetical protein